MAIQQDIALNAFNRNLSFVGAKNRVSLNCFVPRFVSPCLRHVVQKYAGKVTKQYVFVFVSAGLTIRGLRKLMPHVSLRVLSKSMSIPSIVFMFIGNGFKNKHHMRSITII